MEIVAFCREKLNYKNMIKEITDFPDYFVTDDGRVFSTKRGEMKELKPGRNKDGYLTVLLCRDDGARKRLYVHRLVATVFIPNPDNLPCVNHKDENKTNNCVDNLEHCTHQYNDNYGTKPKRISETLTGRKSSGARKHTPKVRCLELGITFDCNNACDRYFLETYGINIKVVKILKRSDQCYPKLKLHFEEVIDDPNQLSLEL